MPADFLSQAAVLAAFIERYILSLFYLAYAAALMVLLRQDWLLHLHSDLRSNDSLFVNQTYTWIVSQGLLIMLLFFMGLVLLLGRRAVVTPRNLAELVVPMAAAFYYVLYDQYSVVPQFLQDDLAPANWQPALTATGLVLGAIGGVISVWGLFCLGRCFGIFVGVRGIVLRGPYHYLRHPMYFGYILGFIGMTLAWPCWFYLILVPIHIGLFAWRAHLEEARLAEFSPEYRENMKRTGFLFPKFRRMKAA